jgi:glucosamine-6-phosphate deaminase
MRIEITSGGTDLGARAAARAAELIRAALAQSGAARIIVATGASQFATLGALVAQPGIDWGRITVFHLDEYIALDPDHPASFRRYLRERFIEKLPRPPAVFHAIDPGPDDASAAAECRRQGGLIGAAPIDVALIGIGENGHLAFNDPPADFETDEPYLIVKLDEACRRQQVGEGWFAALDEVPQAAVSMSIRQIMASRAIIASVPDGRKAAAVAASVEGPVTPLVPASILQCHPDCLLLLDPDSSSRLSGRALR